MKLIPRRRSLATVVAIILCVAVIYLAVIRNNDYPSADITQADKQGPGLPDYVRDIQPHYNRPSEPLNPTGRVNVILLSYIHAGVPFVSELFERNPDIFYMFEPFHAFNYFKAIGRTYPSADFDLEMQPVAEKVTFLRDLLNCNITYQPYIDYLNDVVHHNVYHSDMHIRHSPPLIDVCKNISNLAICRQFTAALVSNKCRSYNGTVLRIIRISDLEPYAKIIAETETKVIQLVRDPRAIIAEKIQARYNIGNETQSHICQSIVANSETTGIDQAVVRYEQVAMYPQSSAKMLYNYTGLKLNELVLQWAEENVPDRKYSPRGTGKDQDSIHPIFQWRLNIPWAVVVQIQNNPHCAKVMEMYSYPQYANEDDLRNFNLPALP